MRFKTTFYLCVVSVIVIVSGLGERSLAQQVDWAVAVGGTSADYGYSVTSDKSGAVYAGGIFAGIGDFDPGPDSAALVSNGSSDAFLLKLDASGNFVWAAGFGGSQTDAVNGVALDDSANVYATGTFNGRVDFDPGPDSFMLESAGSTDMFLVKYDSAGNFIWAKSWGGEKTDYAEAIAVDSEGNVYITGDFNGLADFNPSTAAADTFFMTSSSTVRDAFILKLDRNGNFIWAAAITGAGSEYANAVSVDDLGYLNVAGYMNGRADFDPGPDSFFLVPKGGTDAYIARYDTAGNFVWARHTGGSGADQSAGSAADRWGNVYTSGYFTSYPVWLKHGMDSIVVTAPPVYAAQELFLTKWTPSGDLAWTKVIGGEGSDYDESVAVDRAGNVYITGRFRGKIYPVPADSAVFVENPNGSNDDIYILKFDSSGNYLWGGAMGSGGAERGMELHTDASGNVLLTGYFNSNTIDMDPGAGSLTLNTAGGYDVFVVKFSCDDIDSSSVTAAADCNGYELEGVVYMETGIYRIQFANISGCDSMVTLDLSVNHPQVAIDAEGDVLVVIGTFTSYQWYLDDARLDNETGREIRVVRNGSYHVVATDAAGCSVISAKYNVNNVSVQDQAGQGHTRIRIYPNPAEDIVRIDAPVPADVLIYSIDGRLIRHAAQVREIRIADLPEGVYMLSVTAGAQQMRHVERLIKK